MKWNCFLTRIGFRWKYHTRIWQAHEWRQVDEGFAVVDDFGTLVTVARGDAG